VGPSDSLLEVGCGIGVGAALALQEFGPRIVAGIDISNDQIARALDFNAAAITKCPDRLMFQAGSALTIPAEDKSFDSASLSRRRSTSKICPCLPARPTAC
jgi:ubiquinone/menaquinone biosynthesis C-methylase UbiE